MLTVTTGWCCNVYIKRFCFCCVHTLSSACQHANIRQLASDWAVISYLITTKIKELENVLTKWWCWMKGRGEAVRKSVRTIHTRHFSSPQRQHVPIAYGIIYFLTDHQITQYNTKCNTNTQEQWRRYDFLLRSFDRKPNRWTSWTWPFRLVVGSLTEVVFTLREWSVTGESHIIRSHAWDQTELFVRWFAAK